MTDLTISSFSAWVRKEDRGADHSSFNSGDHGLKVFQSWFCDSKGEA
jgi:hypothetical protein